MFSEEKSKKELLQIYYRYAILALVSIYVYISSPLYFFKKVYGLNLITIFIVVFIANTAYLYMVKRRISFLEDSRIYIAAFFDVFVTLCSLYIADIFSPFLSFLFLWFIVGYGSKYGLKIGIFTTICVNIAWILLISYSPFWIKNPSVAVGWLLTFLFIPPYFLQLLSKLQKQYDALSVNFNKTEYEAKHDFLTKLINRNYFEKNLLESVKNSIENNTSFALLFIDLDGFKKINDKLGHDIGDEVLIEVAKRLNMIKKQKDIVSRLGGDEFAIITHYTSYEDISQKASEIINILSRPYAHSIDFLSASIGISVYPKDTTSLSRLKKSADIAMYNAKNRKGKGRFSFYGDISNAKSV